MSLDEADKIKKHTPNLKRKMKPLIVLFLIHVEATNANYMKKYCGNSIYIPHGNRYPHLHCGKDFFTLSVKKKVKEPFVTAHGVDCKRVKKVLGDPGRYYNNIGDITRVLQNFHRKECSNEL